MNKRTLSFIALSAIALLAAPALVAQEPGAPERNRATDEAAVLAVVDSSLAAVSAEDFEAFADLMLPEAMAFPVWEQVGELAYRARSREDQRSKISGARSCASIPTRPMEARVRCRLNPTQMIAPIAAPARISVG
jgi:hypothetical protein